MTWLSRVRDLHLLIMAPSNDMLLLAAFQMLRVYAISGRKWQPVLVVGVFNSFPICLSIVRTSHLHHDVISMPITCCYMQYLWTTFIFVSFPPLQQVCLSLSTFSEELNNRCVVSC